MMTPTWRTLSATTSVREDGKVRVSRVSSGLDTDRFIKFQWQVYRTTNDLHWVPPLLMEQRDFLDARRNPFYRHADVALFLARRGDEVVGRIAGIEDGRYNEFHGERVAYFGLYESVNDPAVAAALFGAVREWSRWRGLHSLIGPVNLSPNSVGILVEGFDSEPYLMMPYNPRYYRELFEGCGLRRSKDLLAWERSVRTPPPDRYQRIAEKLRRQPGLVTRGLDMRRFGDEVDLIKQVYDAAWEKSWGPVPMTDEELHHLAKQLRHDLVPDMALIIEDHGQPVAFSLVIPDLNQALRHLDGRITSFGLPLGLARLYWHSRGIDRVRLVAAGIRPGWRWRGIEALVVTESIERARRHGFQGGEVSWTAEDNPVARRSIEAAGCTLSKRYRLYEASVG